MKYQNKWGAMTKHEGRQLKVLLSFYYMIFFLKL